MLRKVAVLLFLAGCAMAISQDEMGVQAQGNKASQNNNNQYSALQKLERLYYKIYCKIGAFVPQWLSTIPLKSKMIKERIDKVGATPDCLELMLKAEFQYPSWREMRTLKQSKLPIIWVLGGPGSGKGTFCSRMEKSEGYTHISLGDLIRAENAEHPDTFSTHIIQETMKQGQLLPDSFSLMLLARKMESVLDSSKGILIDGFPRTVGQAKLFQKKIRAPDSIVVLQVGDDILKQRVLNRNDGRTDDNEETLRKRLNVYHKQSEPITSNKMFAKRIKIVNAEGELEENYNRFSEAIRETVNKT